MPDPSTRARGGEPITVHPPRPDDPATRTWVVANCQFRSARVKPIRRGGAYRGSGSISIAPDGIRVTGKTRLPGWQRLLIGLGIAFGSALLTMGRAIVGILPILLLLEYVILRDGSRLIGWERVSRFAADPRRGRVEIETDEPERNIQPIVLEAEQWQQVAAALRWRCPELEAGTVPDPAGPSA